MQTFLIIIGIVGAVFGIGAFAGTRGMKEIKDMKINNPDTSKLADGVYQGEFHHARWNYVVEVKIQDGKIAGISNLSGGVAMKSAQSDFLIQAVIGKQKVNLDTFSGATIDSKSFLKAVENAISQTH